MKKIIIAIFLIITQPINAQTPNELLGLQLDTFIQMEMATQSIPGLSACIVKGNQVIWKAAYGMANFETNTPVNLETEFTLASISKLFTATACAQLWESGNLDIDADINNYLPIEIINPNFSDIPITTRQLLTHKSSLSDYESDLQLWDAPGDPIFELPFFCENYFTANGSLFDANNFADTSPGMANYWYSNAGFTLLGYIVEEVSGMPFNEYVREKILEPLEMNSSGWFYSEVDSNSMAMPYSAALQPYGFYSVPEYPAAMLKSNVDELANFLIAYTQKGIFKGQELVSPNTFTFIVPDNMTNGFAWWGTDTWWGDPSGNYWSHGGFMNGVRTQLNYYPQDSTGLIILTNGEGSYTNIENKMEEYIPLFQTDVISNSSEVPGLKIDIFPNPLTGEKILNVQFSKNRNDKKKLSIYNSDGNLIFSKASHQLRESIKFSDFPSGVYFIKIMNNEHCIINKIIVP